jgi:hypothetical protein
LHYQLKHGNGGRKVGQREACRGLPTVAIAIAPLKRHGAERPAFAALLCSGIDEHQRRANTDAKRFLGFGNE